MTFLPEDVQPDTRPLIVAVTTPADPMQPATRLYCGLDPLMAAAVAAWHEARTGEPVQVTGGGEWAGLTPPYSTIVVDPPWRYEQGGPRSDDRWGGGRIRTPPYTTMSDEAIAAMPVVDLAAADAHLYLWTTNRYLRASFSIAQCWGFQHSQTLTWCKPPRGIGPGGAFSNTTEFVLFCRRGSLAPLTRLDTTWWRWPRGPHSVKPPAFLDLVEQVSPGPYVELFARAPRLGWDSWGYGFEDVAS